jgi:hypothetical protein
MPVTPPSTASQVGVPGRTQAMAGHGVGGQLAAVYWARIALSSVVSLTCVVQPGHWSELSTDCRHAVLADRLHCFARASAAAYSAGRVVHGLPASTVPPPAPGAAASAGRAAATRPGAATGPGAPTRTATPAARVDAEGHDATAGRQERENNRQTAEATHGQVLQQCVCLARRRALPARQPAAASEKRRRLGFPWRP